MGKLRQSTAKIQELLDKVEQGGGAGLKYSVERTVYPNKLVIGEYVEEAEITEEERAYNAETYIKTWNDGNVVIAFEGGFLTNVFSTNTPSTGEGKVMFNVVVEIQDVLVSYTVTIYYNGDATVEAKEVQTSGGSIDPELLEDYLPMAREFSDDFNNDFAR